MRHVFAGLFLMMTAIGLAGQTTNARGYQAVREAVAAADHDPNAVERTYAYYEANLTDAVFVPVQDRLYTASYANKVTYANYIDFIFTFSDPNDTAVTTIYAIRDPDGIIEPMEPVCSYTLAAGTQQTGESPARYFADQATQISNPWTATLLDYGGDDGILKINHDSRGYWGFIILFTTLGDGDVSVYAAYY